MTSGGSGTGGERESVRGVTGAGHTNERDEGKGPNLHPELIDAPRHRPATNEQAASVVPTWGNADAAGRKGANTVIGSSSSGRPMGPPGPPEGDAPYPRGPSRDFLRSPATANQPGLVAAPGRGLAELTKFDRCPIQ